MNKKILMICYYFPPLLDVGCKRSVAFSKYLNSHGWYPFVLSVRNPDKHYCMVGDSPPPQNVRIRYTWSLFSLSWFFGKLNGLVNKIFSLFGKKLDGNYIHILFSIPDLFLGWIPGAIVAGYRIIKKYDIGYIYVSCTPYSSAIAGLFLKKITKKPLIIDFRDPFAIHNIHKFSNVFSITQLRKKIDIKIERKIISSTDIFIVNNEEVGKIYKDLYPDYASKIIVIHNGFDHEALPPHQLKKKYDTFTISYGGNMYFQNVESRPFFESLSWLKKTGKISAENFQFLYFGVDHQTVKELAQEFKITEIVKVQTYISHPEMLEVLKKSHLQLLRIIKPLISTKLFEGIALDLPFLATIPPGEVADIIKEYSPSSYIIHDDSAQAIGEGILAAMLDHHRGVVKSNLVSQFLHKYSREKLTLKLIKAIENFNESEKVSNPMQL